MTSLDNSKLGSSNVKSIDIGCKTSKSLLGAVRSANNITLAFHTHLLHQQRQRDTNTYLIKVLILTVSTSYSFFSASLICLLFALTSTINTNVLFSSIFFIALSVFNGWIMTFCASRRGSWGTERRGYFGARDRRSVLGRWKVVFRRTLRTLCELTCLWETGRQRWEC